MVAAGPGQDREILSKSDDAAAAGREVPDLSGGRHHFRSRFAAFRICQSNLLSSVPSILAGGKAAV
jgi:hypothetical protein